MKVSEYEFRLSRWPSGVWGLYAVQVKDGEVMAVFEPDIIRAKTLSEMRATIEKMMDAFNYPPIQIPEEEF